MSIITIAAQKGGVGKTTTAVNLAAALAKLGEHILLLDTDPQANASDTVGAAIDGTATLYDLLTQQCDIGEAIQHIGNLDVIAADPLLAGVETAMASAIGKEYRLRDALAPIAGNYDHVIIDTPPQLGLLMLNALTAASEVIIPFTPDRYSLAGIAQLTDTISNTRRYLNPSLQIMGLLACKTRDREKLTRAVAAELPDIARTLGTRVFDTEIHNAMGVRTAQSERHTLFMGTTSASVAAADFLALAKEILKLEEDRNG